MHKFLYPWEHYVVDNFFSEEILYRLKEEKIESINFAENGTGRDSVSNRCFITHDYKSDLGKSLIKEYESYFSILFPIAGDLYDGHYRIEIANDSDMYYSNPHLDSLDKKVTIITYISAPKNLGTDLYTTHDSKPYNVKWKDNRSLIFKPGNKEWHGMRKYTWQGLRRVIIFNTVLKENWKLIEQLWINN